METSVPVESPIRTGKSITRVATILALFALLFAFLSFANGTFNDYRLQLLILVAINGSIAVSLTMSNGFTGVFSLGQIGFLAIGAYVSALINLQPTWKGPMFLPTLPSWLANLDTSSWPPLVALGVAGLAGGLCASIVALLVGYPLMRLSGHYVAVATMGFLIIVHTVLIDWDTLTLGARGLNPIPTHTTVWSAFGWLSIVVYLCWRIRTSSFGREMISSRENLIAAKAVGVSVHRARLLAFVVSGFLTGVSGGLLAHQIGTVTPSAYYFTTTFAIVIMVVLGGLGSISGAVVGAIIMTLAPEYLRDVEDGMNLGPLSFGAQYGLSQIILAVGFVLVMIFRPKGLLGDREIPLDVMRWRRSQR